MNAAEGLNRIALIIKILGWVGFAASLAIAVSMGTSQFDSSESWFPPILGIAGLAIAYGVAWVIQGFTKPKTS